MLAAGPPYSAAPAFSQFISLKRGVRHAVWPVARVLAGVATVLAGFALYYGTALPLSFYLKSGQSSLYDEHFLALSRISKRENLIFVAITMLPAMFVIAHHVREHFVLTLLLPASLFVAYHGVSTVEVMRMHGRFYAPALPFVGLAAAHAYPRYRSVRRLWPTFAFPLVYAISVVVLYRSQWVPTMEGWPIGRTGPWTYGGYVVAVCAVLLATSSARAWIANWAWMPIAVGVAMAHPMGRLGWPTFPATRARTNVV